MQSNYFKTNLLFNFINNTVVFILKGLESIFKKIHSELLANRMMHERLWNQMNSLKSEFANIKHQMLPGLLFSNDSKDTEFLEQFPFHTEESVLACEQILQTDDNVNEKFVCLFTKTIDYYIQF